MATTDKNTGAVQEVRGRATSAGESLDRNALNLPNLITLGRLGLAFVLFTLIYVEGYWISSAVLFLVAASTDVLDGWIARRYGLVTALGRILDPFVDKIIVCGAFIFLLGQQAGGDSGVNAWMVLIVVGREMFISSLRGFLERRGKDFSAAWSGKVKMLTQSAAVTFSLLSLSPSVSSGWFLQTRDVLLWAAVAATLYSGLAYVFRASAMMRR